jgi:hypothetical protein
MKLNRSSLIIPFNPTFVVALCAAWLAGLATTRAQNQVYSETFEVDHSNEAWCPLNGCGLFSRYDEAEFQA